MIRKEQPCYKITSISKEIILKFITAFFALAIILFCLAVHWPWPVARSTEANPTRKSSLILFSQNNNDFESLLDPAKPASVKIDRSKQQLYSGKSILCCLRFPKIIEMEEVLKFLKSKQSPRSHKPRSHLNFSRNLPESRIQNFRLNLIAL